MRKKIMFLLSIAAFVMGVTVFAVPSTTHATSTTINTVTVTVGATTACITGCGANSIWSAAAGTTLTSTDVAGPNKVLILTQTSASPFNFDSSDNGGNGCNAAHLCATSLTINGVVIALSGANADALANFNNDPLGVTHQESTDWGTRVFNGGPGGLSVWFGYADTAHNNTCTDPDSDCLPGTGAVGSPWSGTPNTVFIGGPSQNASGDSGCDKPGFTAPCFDAGAIRIEVNATPPPPPSVPEPSAMMLLGVGLVGLAAWGKRQS